MPFPDCVPELADGLVRLRAHRRADLPRIVEQSHDPGMLEFTTVPRPYRLADAEQFLDLVRTGWTEDGGRRHWAVTRADDPRASFLGTIDLRADPAVRGVAEVGFGLHPEGRGQGLMSHSLRLLARHWFDQGGVRVYWRATRGNFPSRRVAWACGFTIHATLPQVLAHPEGPQDGWVGSLGRDDPMEPRNPWYDPPVLDAGSVRLRPWRDGDAGDLEEPDHPAHFMPARAALTPQGFAGWLARRREQAAAGTGLCWCIADAATDRALGEVVLFSPGGTLDGDHAELGYQVLPSARGRGVATAATGAAAAYAFRPPEQGGLGLRRLVAETAADNDASNAVLTRLGFTVWGRQPAVDRLPDGAFGDALHWASLAPSSPERSDS